MVLTVFKLQMAYCLYQVSLLCSLRGLPSAVRSLSLSAAWGCDASPCFSFTLTFSLYQNVLSTVTFPLHFELDVNSNLHSHSRMTPWTAASPGETRGQSLLPRVTERVNGGHTQTKSKTCGELPAGSFKFSLARLKPLYCLRVSVK